MSPFFTQPSQALLRVAISVRVLLLSPVVTLAVLGNTSTATRFWLVAGICGCSIGATGQLTRRWPRSSILAEFVICVTAAAATGGTGGPLAPLLIAAALPAGVVGGVAVGCSLPLVGAVAMVATHALLGQTGVAEDVMKSTAQWAALGVLLGFVGAWAERLVRDAQHKPSYATAHRLLSELRTVTRRLPTGLDSRTIAAHILDELHDVLPFSEGTVSLRNSVEQYVAIANRADRPTIPVQTSADDGLAGAPAPVRLVRKSVDLPLVTADGDVGIVTLTGGSESFPAAGLAAAAALLSGLATQLEAALLFDEVRELATVEERHRLARSIHDGIAQELVSVSYALDNAVSEADRDVMSSQILTARSELRRILSELRLSIYDLRSDTRPTVSLATALSSYVHSIGRDWGMTIHVQATESRGRLPAECEAELLRIAQEALTNARKHAAADNIWVTLAVQAPHAWLRIEDDGTGFANPHSAKSFGLHIMKERAARIGATFRVVRRPARGTLVEVVLGNPDIGDAEATKTLVVRT